MSRMLVAIVVTLVVSPWAANAFDPTKVDPASQAEFVAYLDCAKLYEAAEEREFDAAEKEKLNKCISTYGDKILDKAKALASMPKDDQLREFRDSIYNQFEMNNDGWVNG